MITALTLVAAESSFSFMDLQFQEFWADVLFAGVVAVQLLGVVAVVKLWHKWQKGKESIVRSPVLQRSFSLVHATMAGCVALMFVLPQPGGGEEAESVFPLQHLLTGQLGYLLVVAVVVFFCVSTIRRSFYALFVKPGCAWLSLLLRSVVYGLAAIPVITLLTMLTNQVLDMLGYPTELQPVFHWLEQGGSPFSCFVLFFALIISAPVIEEFLFRGILLPGLASRIPLRHAMLVSSLCFALIHLHPPSIVPLGALSLCFSAGYLATGSIVTPIIMHVIFNLHSIMLFFSNS